MQVYVDADACPVKQEVLKVAKRYGLGVIFVSNALMRLPGDTAAQWVVVKGQFDAADDWIAERASTNDIVVTADIQFASRCIKKGARVLSPTGKVISDANIGPMLATRNLLSELRGAGIMSGGPPPFQKRDRSRFLQNLDQIIQDIKRSV